IRPFPGTTAFQLAAQHTCAPPMLDPLLPQDRDIIARALSKLPEQRFPSCRELMERLRAATASPSGIMPQPQPDRLLSMDTMHPPTAASRPPHPSRLRNRVTPAPVSVPSTPVGTNVLTSDPGGLRPTLFVGIGGLAGLVLRRLKRRLFRQFGDL